MISGARDDDGASVPGRISSPVTTAALLLVPSRFCVELVVAVVLVAPQAPGAAGEAALPALKISTRSPMPVVVFQVPPVSPGMMPPLPAALVASVARKLRPVATACSL